MDGVERKTVAIAQRSSEPSSAAIEAKARLLAADSLDALASLWKAMPGPERSRDRQQ